MFSTYDRDNDQGRYNCAVTLGGGGFWYNACSSCGVNMARRAVFWSGLPGGTAGRDLRTSRMWLQCVSS